MRQSKFSSLGRRLRDASWLTAIYGLMLILATGCPGSVDVRFGPQRIIQATDLVGAMRGANIGGSIRNRGSVELSTENQPRPPCTLHTARSGHRTG